MKMIIPKRLWVGAFIPNWLLRRTDVSSNCKLVYASLCQSSTDYGVVFAKQEEIGEEVGMSLRTVQRALTDLEDHTLIDKRQVGMGQPNEYRFPHHAWMNGPELVTQVETTPSQPKKKETKSGTQGTRIQKDWQPDTDTTKWAVDLVGNDGVKWQIEKFKNYWLSKSGARGLKLCWQRTFRSWIQNEIEWDNITPLSGYKSGKKGKDFVRGTAAREERQSGLREALDRKLATSE
tara:strand:- start:191 stop:892 length:702 start_codon:yes stop_codon:yes gene_type:complete